MRGLAQIFAASRSVGSRVVSTSCPRVGALHDLYTFHANVPTDIKSPTPSPNDIVLSDGEQYKSRNEMMNDGRGTKI